MNEKEFRKLMKEKGLVMKHHRGVVFAWSLSYPNGNTIACSRTLKDLQEYYFTQLES